MTNKNDEQSPSQPEVYEPWQVAQMLGISTTTLSRLRREGKIQGRRTGTSTVYTLEQIQTAKLTRKKPGPKVGEGSRVGRAKYEWPEDEKLQQIDEKGREMKKSSDGDDNGGGDLPSAGPRWRPSDSGKRRILVGA